MRRLTKKDVKWAIQAQNSSWLISGTIGKTTWHAYMDAAGMDKYPYKGELPNEAMRRPEYEKARDAILATLQQQVDIFNDLLVAPSGSYVGVLPTKPVETVHIEFAGDPSVGIQRGHFEATVWIDPKTLTEEGFREDIERTRQMFKDVYSHMTGEDVGVLFDFEIEEINRKVDALTEEQA